MEEQAKELRAEMNEQGIRVSQSALEQARLNGVNSVLVRQIHTNESTETQTDIDGYTIGRSPARIIFPMGKIDYALKP